MAIPLLVILGPTAVG
ncbi:MAG: hypothetical protein COW28_00495, partial [bacterium (Candidatus Ratteibacteria) CG15_BIG_FIL_POST_REV_8_21_14_020_41_12]